MLKTPVGRKISTRFVAGEDTARAVTVARQLARQGLDVSLDFLGEDTTDRSQACATVDAYRALAAYLAADGLARAPT
jgi:proline dehydrogenase